MCVCVCVCVCVCGLFSFSISSPLSVVTHFFPLVSCSLIILTSIHSDSKGPMELTFFTSIIIIIVQHTHTHTHTHTPPPPPPPPPQQQQQQQHFSKSSMREDNKECMCLSFLSLECCLANGNNKDRVGRPNCMHLSG